MPFARPYGKHLREEQEAGSRHGIPGEEGTGSSQHIHCAVGPGSQSTKTLGGKPPWLKHALAVICPLRFGFPYSASPERALILARLCVFPVN